MDILAVIDRLAGGFILSFGWRRALAAFVAGAVSALAMPPFDFFFVLFLTFPVLVWLMDATASDPARGVGRFWQAFKTGWCFGFGYFLAGLWWIGNAFLIEADQFAWMLPFAVMLLPAALAVFYGVAMMIARLFWRNDWRRLLALGGAIALAEYLRGAILTGFPWNAIGYGAMTNPLAMQKASVFGLYGVCALAVPVFSVGALAASPRHGSRGGIALPLLAALAIVCADFGFGYWHLRSAPLETVENVRVRLVQPAIDQSEKWTPDVQDRNFGLLLDLSRGSGGDGGLADISLLVWPESAFPFILTQRSDALAALGELLPASTMLVAGAIRLEPGQETGRPFNSVYTINAQGVVSGASDKLHLVPFGEYLPFQETAESFGLMQLTHLRGGFQAGQKRRLLDAGRAGRFLALICYEIIFPGQITQDGERPDWLLNLTNDAWFGLTPGPYQHWRQAVVRGVEEGLPVVRVANSGISSVTDSHGRIVARIDLGKRGIADTALPVAGMPTVYSRYRNLPFLAILALFGVILILPRRSR